MSVAAETPPYLIEASADWCGDSAGKGECISECGHRTRKNVDVVSGIGKPHL